MEVLRQIRLSFITSQGLMDNGGSKHLDDKDFSEAIEAQNEEMTFRFIIENFEKQLEHLKARDFYADKLANMPQVTSIEEYN